MTTPTRLQTNAAHAFQCLGGDCEDTCCKGWGMQLTKQTVEKYEREAPELLDAVTSGEAEYIMKRDPGTDYCIKFVDGLCSIHKARGTEFLGDACHFFPRSTRALGDVSVMTIAPSCPEATRLMLRLDAPFNRVSRDDPREPFSLKDYGDKTGALSSSDMLELHDKFLQLVEDAKSPQEAVMLIAHVSRRLDSQPQKDWLSAFDFYLKQAPSSIAAAEHKLADVIHILNAFQGLIKAAKVTSRPRLMQTLDEMAKALAVTLDWDAVTVNPSEESLKCITDMHLAWDGFYAGEMAQALKRYIQMQLSLNLFPFAGLGKNLQERSSLLAVRYATVERALMCKAMLEEEVPGEEDVVRIIQSISRFLDHLADVTLSLDIYREVGWLSEPRLHGLLTLPKMVG